MRPIVRVALRDLRRHRGRSALLLLLVAAPVAGVTFLSTLFTSTIPTRDERLSSWFSDAEMRVVQPDTTETGRPIPDLVPPGTRAVEIHEYAAVAERPGRRVQFLLTDLPVGDPVVKNRIVLRSGRLPAAPGEIAMSSSLLAQLDGRVGWAVGLDDPDRSFIVVGQVANPIEADRLEAVILAADVPAGTAPTWLVETGNVDPRLVEGHLRAAAGEGAFDIYRRDGVLATLRKDRRPDLTLLVGAAVLLVTGLVVAAAFATAARRHTRTLALLAATGAEPSQLRSLFVAQALVLGAVAAAAGLAVGLVSVLVLSPRLEHLANRTSVAVRVPVLQLVAVGAAAVVASLAAALVPAWHAGRAEIAQALAAKRPARPMRWLPPTASVLLGGGLGWLWLGGSVTEDPNEFLLAVGASAALAGGALSAPALLRILDRRAGGFPLFFRIAARDAARSIPRVAPTTAAGIAALSLAIGMLVVTASRDRYEREQYVPSLRSDQLRVEPLDAVARPAATEAVAAKVAEVVQGSVAARIRVASSRSGVDRSQWVVANGALPNGTGPTRRGLVAVADADVLKALDAPSAVARYLAEGKIVALGAPGISGGQVSLAVPVWTYLEDEGGAGDAHSHEHAGHDELAIREENRVLSVPGAAVAGRSLSALPLYLASEATLQGLGLSWSLESWLVRSSRPLDAGTVRVAREAAGVGTGVSVSVEEPPATDSSFRTLLAGLAVAFAAAIACLATALALAEGRRERVLLDVAGIRPRDRRLAATAQAAFLGGVAVVLAVPLALLATFAGLASFDKYPVVVPWAQVLLASLLVLAVPAVAALALLDHDRQGPASPLAPLGTQV
ncbi:MAG: FtsX-like permease family protein [Acidimicrobiales bacterium]